MRRVMILVLGLSGIVAQGQEVESAIRRNEFKAQMARTPFLIWDWADEDSVFAYQDTLEGVFRMFWGDYTGDEVFERYYVVYDWDKLVNGTNDELLFRDWNSFDLDSGIAFSPLYGENRSIADSLVFFTDTMMGYSWNESYEKDNKVVRIEEVYLERSWKEDGSSELEMVFTKIYGRKENELESK